MFRTLIHLLGVVCVLAFTQANAQAPAWNWMNPINSGSTEGGRVIDIDVANNWLYAAGNWGGGNLSGFFGASFNSTAGGDDIWVAKYDLSGSFIWAFPIGSTGADLIGDIEVDPFGNVYVSGYITGNADFRGTSGVPAPLNSVNQAAFLAKYDPSGAHLWSLKVETNLDCRGLGIESDANGVYFTGFFEGNHTFNSSLSATANPIPSIASPGTETVFVTHYDHGGFLRWLAEGYGTNRELGIALALDGDKVYVGGNFESPTLSFYDGSRPGSPNAALGNNGNTDIFILALDKASGAYRWSETISTTLGDNLIGIEADGNLFVSGIIGGASPAFPGGLSPVISNPPISGAEIFLSSHDTSSGFAQIAKVESGGGVRDLFGMDSDQNGRLVLTGEFNSSINFSGNVLVPLSGRDVFIAKYDTSLNPVWATAAGGNGTDAGFGVALFPGGNTYATGYCRNLMEFPPLGVVMTGGSESIFIGELEACEASFFYASSTFCRNASNPAPTLSGQSGGVYSEISGNISFVSAASGVIDLAGSTPGGPYTIVYTAPGGCQGSFSVSISDPPTLANAGPDQNLCGVSSTLLAANIPASGTGSWTILSGVGGSVLTPADPTSTFNGGLNQTYELIWTISAAGCPASRDTVSVTFDPAPTAAAAGPDQSLCGVTNTTLAANAPVVGSGMWSIFSGVGGSVTTPGDPVSAFSGTSGQTYELIWTISAAGCPASRDTVSITFDPAPTAAAAGPDQSLCGVTNTTLAANSPVVGTGMWSIFTGVGGSVTTPGDPVSGFSGVSGQTYELIWTIIAAGCPASRDTVSITFDAAPTVSAAGPDQGLCGVSNTTLAANVPAVGTGMWSIFTGVGGSVTTPGDPVSGFSGVSGQTYELIWTISAAGCPASRDTVSVTFDAAPTAAAAGPDQNLCGVTNTTLAANAPAVGTGMWSIFSGVGGSLTTPGDPVSGFSGVSGQTYELIWTISAAGCPASRDTVSVTFQGSGIPVFAGPDQDICGDSLNMLASPQTGLWTVVSGAGVFSDPNDPNASVTDLSPGLNVLQWKVGASGCEDSATVSITSFENPQSEVGPNQILTAEFSTNLEALVTVSGNGEWSLVEGKGSIRDPNTAVSSVSDLEYGDNVFRWTVSNGVCPDAFSEVLISVERALVPTGFSPNGDNVNDFFVIKGLEREGKVSLKVFSRWGNLVYSADAYANQWEGTDVKGNQLTDDTYYLLLEYENGSTYNGIVVIRR